MSSATSSSSPSPTSSSSNQNVTGIAIGVSLGLLVLLAIAIFLFWFLRRRGRQHVTSTQPRHPVRRSTLLDPSHPACRVTPFGTPGSDTPRFVHEPGANMRVAHRRSDGGWEFSEMTPDNWSTFDLPAPRLSLSSRSTLSYVSKEKLKLQPGELTTRGFVEHDLDLEENPPPAYSNTDQHSVSTSEV